ncbi:hypothetical protein V8F06_001457 [Rhypophila decipiens]
MQLSTLLLLLSGVATTVLAAPATPKTNDLVLRENANPGPLAKRSFMASCTACEMGTNPTRDFHCKCRNNAGARVPAYLNLDNCLVNDMGVPKWRRGGGFSASCTGYLGMKQTEFVLNTLCKNGKGGTTKHILPLNYNIHNDNGAMRCEP